MENFKLDINDIPELDNQVGLHGSYLKEEVGGPACLVIITVTIWLV